MSPLLALVLGVASDFDDFGGASPELVAWELGLEPEAMLAAWGDAVDAGLLEAAPRDRIFGEEMFRVTVAGRAMLERQGSDLDFSDETIVPLAAARRHPRHQVREHAPRRQRTARRDPVGGLGH